MPNVSFVELKKYEELLSLYLQLQMEEEKLSNELTRIQSFNKNKLDAQLDQAIQSERNKRQLEENAQAVSLAQAEELTLGTDAYQIAETLINSFISSDYYNNFVYAVLKMMSLKSDIEHVLVSNHSRLDLREFSPKMQVVTEDDVLTIVTEDAQIDISKKQLQKNIAHKLVQAMLQ